MITPTRSRRRKPLPNLRGPRMGTHGDPEWLTPSARAEIRSAAAEWNAGMPATQTDESRVDDHDPEAAARMIAGLYRAGPRWQEVLDLLIWAYPALLQPEQPGIGVQTVANLGRPDPWPRRVGRGPSRPYDGQDQYAHHAYRVPEALRASGLLRMHRDLISNPRCRRGKTFKQTPDEEIERLACRAKAEGVTKRRLFKWLDGEVKKLPLLHPARQWWKTNKLDSNKWQALWRILARLGFTPW